MDFSNITSFISNIVHFDSTQEKKQATETRNPLAHAAENVKHQEPAVRVASTQIGTSHALDSEMASKQQTFLDSVVMATSSLRKFISETVDELEFAIPGFQKETIQELGTVKSIKVDSQVLNQEIINTNLVKLRAIVGKEKTLLEFRETLKGMIEGSHKAEAAKCIELLLEEFETSASTHHSSGVRYKAHEGFDRDAYNNLNSYLSLTFKNFRKYFNTVDPYKSGIDNTGLNQAGVEHVLGRLSGEGKLHGVKCICCQGTDATAKESSTSYTKDPQRLTFQIEAQIEQMKKIKGPARCTFVVGQSAHFTPIFLEKTADGKFHVLITDSTGNNDYYISTIKEDINVALKRSSVSGKSEIYVYTKQRQFDQTNCAAFAIHDVVKMSKNADHLFTWIQDNGKIGRSKEGRVHSFYRLPPTMMKTAPRSVVDKYAKEVTDSKLSSFLQKHTVRALVDIRNEEHRIVDVGSKDFNPKVSKAYLKYERQLMTQLMLDGEFNF